MSIHIAPWVILAVQVVVGLTVGMLAVAGVIFIVTFWGWNGPCGGR